MSMRPRGQLSRAVPKRSCSVMRQRSEPSRAQASCCGERAGSAVDDHVELARLAPEQQIARRAADEREIRALARRGEQLGPSGSRCERAEQLLHGCCAAACSPYPLTPRAPALIAPGARGCRQR